MIAKHPSGHVIRRYEQRGRGFLNVPSVGPIVPHLQKTSMASVIGFRVSAEDVKDTSTEETARAAGVIWRE